MSCGAVGPGQAAGPAPFRKQWRTEHLIRGDGRWSTFMPSVFSSLSSTIYILLNTPMVPPAPKPEPTALPLKDVQSFGAVHNQTPSVSHSMRTLV
ncbi:hypothetical protein AcW1_007264 [Taiwanofungus camphoratus]|nr:hypothetical protein AcV5_008039 [Antrodia cinnamomea]KAI0952905.1 hypothetical protein AcW1_007264 [Antrodia cinnamomea]